MNANHIRATVRREVDRLGPAIKAVAHINTARNLAGNAGPRHLC